MNLNMKFYILVEYDWKNMCDFFKIFIKKNLVYVHDIYTKRLYTRDTFWRYLK
jgi:hypothetical protein